MSELLRVLAVLKEDEAAIDQMEPAVLHSKHTDYRAFRFGAQDVGIQGRLLPDVHQGFQPIPLRFRFLHFWLLGLLSHNRVGMDNHRLRCIFDLALVDALAITENLCALCVGQLLGGNQGVELFDFLAIFHDGISLFRSHRFLLRFSTCSQ